MSKTVLNLKEILISTTFNASWEIIAVKSTFKELNVAPSKKGFQEI